MSDLHQIHVGPRGTFQRAGTVQTTPEDVDRIIAHLEQHQLDRIGIYLHGGLVDEQAGMAGAERFRQVFAGAGLHGISLVWETGWWETIQKNLTTVFSTKLFQWLVEKVIEKLLQQFTGLGAKGPGGAQVKGADLLQDASVDIEFANQARRQLEAKSALDLEKWRKEWEGELELDIEADQQFQQWYLDQDQRTELFDDPTLSLESDTHAPRDKAGITWLAVASKLASIAYRVGTRFWNGRDHGLHATTVEEVFREFYLTDLLKTLEWDNMKLAAREMWLPNEGLSDLSQHVGTYFLDQLIALKQRRPGLTIDLVAHSAGAIVTCALFAVLRKRYAEQIALRNVIFLAPASTSLLFHAQMLQGSPLFSNFYLFTMPDELERRDAVMRPAHASLQVVYPSSLLYVVSGMFEEEVDAPLLGMIRFSSGQRPFDSQKLQKIRNFLLAPGKQRLILSSANPPASAEALASCATSHSEFSSESRTMQSIRLILQRSNAVL